MLGWLLWCIYGECDLFVVECLCCGIWNELDVFVFVVLISILIFEL